MRKVLFALSMLMFACSGAVAGERDCFDRTITATGQVVGDYQPELAIINFSVETTGKSASQAAAENSVRADGLIKALKSLPGTENVDTAGYEIYPLYGKLNTPNGYRVVNRIGVRISRLDSIGKIIDTAVNAGANAVNGLEFVLSEEGKYCAPVIAKATEEAAAQAAVTAKALGVKLAGVKSAAPSCAREGAPAYYGAVMMKEAAQTPVTPGTVKVRASVTVVFYIAE